MAYYVKSLDDIQFGGGDLKINTTDATYTDSDFSKFASIGATDKDSGGVLHIGEKSIQRRYNEADKDEPCKEWVDGQDITFETTLVETSLENFVLAIGGDLNAIGDNADASPKFKFYRAYDLVLPKRYPMMYEVPNSDNPSLKTTLIMPACEIVGAAEFTMSDMKAHSVKLTLRLHRVIEVARTELIVNGGFERGPATTFDGWTIAKSGTGWDVLVGKASLNESWGGLRSCILKSGASAGTASVAQTTNVTVTANKSHRFAVRHKATTPNVVLRATIAGVTYPVITDQNANTWGQTVITFEPSASPIAIKVEVIGNSATAYVDEVSLMLVPESAVVSSLAGNKFEIRREYT